MNHRLADAAWLAPDIGSAVGQVDKWERNIGVATAFRHQALHCLNMSNMSRDDCNISGRISMLRDEETVQNDACVSLNSLCNAAVAECLVHASSLARKLLWLNRVHSYRERAESLSIIFEGQLFSANGTSGLPRAVEKTK